MYLGRSIRLGVNNLAFLFDNVGLAMYIMCMVAHQGSWLIIRTRGRAFVHRMSHDNTLSILSQEKKLKSVESAPSPALYMAGQARLGSDWSAYPALPKPANHSTAQHSRTPHVETTLLHRI